MNDKKLECRQRIIALLQNLDGCVRFEHIMPIYFSHYGASGKTMNSRRERVAEFVEQMVADNMVACTYDITGCPVEIRLASAEREAQVRT